MFTSTPLITRLSHSNCHPLEVVSLYRDPQLQVGRNTPLSLNYDPTLAINIADETQVYLPRNVVVCADKKFKTIIVVVEAQIVALAAHNGSTSSVRLLLWFKRTYVCVLRIQYLLYFQNGRHAIKWDISFTDFDDRWVNYNWTNGNKLFFKCFSFIIDQVQGLKAILRSPNDLQILQYFYRTCFTSILRIDKRCLWKCWYTYLKV